MADADADVREGEPWKMEEEREIWKEVIIGERETNFYGNK
jgi:hypothetical protein